MLSSPSQSKKPKLDRKALKQRGVSFDDRIINCSNHTLLMPTYYNITRAQAKLPEQVKRTMKKALAELQRSGHDSEISQDQNWDLMPPADVFCGNRSFIERNISARIEEELEEELEERRETSQLSVTLRKTRNPEKVWKQEIYPKTFRPYNIMHNDADEHRSLLKRRNLYADVYWNESSLDELTSPRPDLTYAFPIIEPTQAIATQHQFDRHVNSFSLPVLYSLQSAHEGGLRPSPNSNLRKMDPNRSETGGAAELMCMREELARKTYDPSKDALLIFSFTFVGPNVRLWLTYRSLKSGSLEMQCIWTTSLEVTCSFIFLILVIVLIVGFWNGFFIRFRGHGDMFPLRSKIDNVREWVYDRVNPEPARWIEATSGLPVPRTILTHEMSVVEQTTKDMSQKGHFEVLSVTSSQDTPRTNRSSGPSPTLSEFGSSSQRKIEQCKDKGAVEDHCRDSYKSMRGRHRSDRERRGQYRSDTEEEEDDDDDDEEEGCFSPSKKKSGGDITPTPLRQYPHGIFCGCSRETRRMTKDEDSEDDYKDLNDVREDLEALSYRFSLLSLYSTKRR